MGRGNDAASPKLLDVRMLGDEPQYLQILFVVVEDGADAMLPVLVPKPCWVIMGKFCGKLVQGIGEWDMGYNVVAGPHCRISLAASKFDAAKRSEIMEAAKREYAFGHSIRIEGDRITATAEGTLSSREAEEMAKHLGMMIFAANGGPCVVDVRIESGDGTHVSWQFDESSPPY